MKSKRKRRWQIDDVMDLVAKVHEGVEEIAEDNTTINRVLETQDALRADVLRELQALRDQLSGVIVYRALQDLCLELARPLSAVETMLEEADFSDPETIRGHVASLALTLRNVLSRMGAERITVLPGQAEFDAEIHQCDHLLRPEESPFPDVPPRTIVRVLEDGYMLAGRLLAPARVVVQAEQGALDKSRGGI